MMYKYKLLVFFGAILDNYLMCPKKKARIL